MHIDQKLRAAHGFFVTHAVFHLRSARPLLRRVGENAGTLDTNLAQETAKLIENLLRFKGKAGDDTRSQDKARDARAQLCKKRGKVFFVTTAVHRAKDGVIAVLDGDIEVFEDLLLGRDHVDEVVCDLVGV